MVDSGFNECYARMDSRTYGYGDSDASFAEGRGQMSVKTVVFPSVDLIAGWGIQVMWLRKHIVDWFTFDH